jgi:hypothetical protein
MWHGAHQALAFWGSAANGRHVRRCPGFIQKYEAAWVQPGLQFGPGTPRLDYIHAVLLCGPQVLFFSVRPSQFTTFHNTG